MMFHKVRYIMTESVTTALLGAGVSAGDVLDNQYVRTIVETGCVGLSLFLWIFWIIYKTAYSLYRRTKLAWMKGFSLGYLAGFLGLMVHGLGAITFTMIRTMEIFWFITGVVFVYSSIMDQVEPEILEKYPSQALPAAGR